MVAQQPVPPQRFTAEEIEAEKMTKRDKTAKMSKVAKMSKMSEFEGVEGVEGGKGVASRTSGRSHSQRKGGQVVTSPSLTLRVTSKA